MIHDTRIFSKSTRIQNVNPASALGLGRPADLHSHYHTADTNDFFLCMYILCIEVKVALKFFIFFNAPCPLSCRRPCPPPRRLRSRQPFSAAFRRLDRISSDGHLRVRNLDTPTWIRLGLAHDTAAALQAAAALKSPLTAAPLPKLWLNTAK